jgi:uncharacterized protein YndB with AHSA1/START domain
MTREILHGIEIHADPKQVYDTVSTRSGLAAFWTADVEGDDAQGGELTFGFREAPVRLAMRVSRLDAPTTVEWSCQGAFPFWEGTAVRWSMQPSEHGTRVVFHQEGFADAMPEYDFASISLTWGLIVARLKDVVESGGTPNPALT